MQGEIFAELNQDVLLAECAVGGELGPPESHPCQKGWEAAKEQTRQFQRQAIKRGFFEQAGDYIFPAEREDADAQPNRDEDSAGVDDGVESAKTPLNVLVMRGPGDVAAPDGKDNDNGSVKSEEDCAGEGRGYCVQRRGGGAGHPDDEDEKGQKTGHLFIMLSYLRAKLSEFRGVVENFIR